MLQLIPFPWIFFFCFYKNDKQQLQLDFFNMSLKINNFIEIKKKIDS